MNLDDDNLLNDEWDTGFSISKPKLTTFSTTKDTQQQETGFDSEDESEGVVEEEDEVDDNAQFMLEEEDLDIDRTFVRVVASHGNLFLVTDNSDIIWVEDETDTLRSLSIDRNGANVHKMFIDPTGSHLIISLDSGENYYFNTSSNKKPKRVKQMSRVVIDSVAWNSHTEEKSESTGHILVGTNDSCIYEVELANDAKEPLRIWKLMFDLKDRSDILVSGPITGLRFEYFPKTKNNQIDHFLVMATTPFGCYEFIGGPTFAELFEVYKNKGILTSKELPVLGKRTGVMNSELHFFRQSEDSLAESFAWLSTAGLYHGNLTFGRRKPGDSAIKDSEIIQFDSKATAAVSIAITEFHTVVAFPDRLQIYMQPPGLCSAANDSDSSEIAQVSISSLKVAFQENFTQSRGKLLGLTIDESNNQIYAYTDSSVYKLRIADEERDVWRLYLEQALDPKVSKEEHFDKALRLCKHDAKTRDIVLTAKADYYFKLGQYRNAANIYAKTSKSFEEVAIAFTNKGQKDALRIFLLAKLKSIVSKVTKENEDATQLSCLCTWLTEMYLDKMNELIDEGSKRKDDHLAMRNEFRSFLETNKKYLNKETTFLLISSHGAISEQVYYAMLIEDYERVISYFITEQDYEGALNILYKFCKTRQYEEYFYKFAPVLMQHLPAKMVSTLTSKKFLQPGKLIPALMRYITTHKPGPNEENHVIRYLEWCIHKQQHEDPAIHNLLLSLYASLDDESKLLQFLNTEGESNFYDPKYALRICTEKGKIEACVRLYSAMGLYEDAVELALSMNEIKLARECADKPDDGEFKKKMWLRIAKHVIEKENNVKRAIEFLSYTDKIKLEDILPFFPDFVLIDDFKEEICKSLEEYKNEIEELKSDMHEATQNANLIREDIKELKHRYGYITANSKCDSSNCQKNILAKDFYLFPCQHMFHTDCLIDEIEKFVSRSKAERILELNAKRKKLIETGQMNSVMQTASDNDTMNSSSLASTVANTARDEMKELDDLISSECPFCGDIMINSIDTAFVDEDDPEFDSWKVDLIAQTE